MRARTAVKPESNPALRLNEVIMRSGPVERLFDAVSVRKKEGQPFALGDVARDFRGAADTALGVLDGRNRHGNVQ